MNNRRQFIDDIASVLNKHSAENDSNTPDFILAEYLCDCFEAFTKISRERERWYGKSLSIGGGDNGPLPVCPEPPIDYHVKPTEFGNISSMFSGNVKNKLHKN